MPIVELGPYRIEIAEEFGPRITGLSKDDGPDLFVRLDPSVAIYQPDADPYVFRGGHRLWASPEFPPITYARDDYDCQWSQERGAVRVWAAADGAGLVKEIRISLHDGDLNVEHRLSAGRRPMAAWGITQLRLGGIAVLGLPKSDTAPLPDRSIVVWPYTDLGDPRLSITDDHIAIEARGSEPLKIGVGPVRARLGYLLDGWLFEKTSDSEVGEVPDFGAASQIYVGQGFCELETVGVLRPPREPAFLTEQWRLSPCDDLSNAVRTLTGAVAA